MFLIKSAIFHAQQSLVSVHIIDHTGSPAFSDQNELCFECLTSTHSPFLMTPRICSTCRKQLPVLSSFMTYHRGCNQINTTGATSAVGIAYPSRAPALTPCFSGVRVTLSSVVCVCVVDRCLSLGTFFFCPLCCLFLFDLPL